jgi:hypothetical protein
MGGRVEWLRVGEYRNMWMGKDKVNGKNLEIYERDC